MCVWISVYISVYMGVFACIDVCISVCMCVYMNQFVILEVDVWCKCIYVLVDVLSHTPNWLLFRRLECVYALLCGVFHMAHLDDNVGQEVDEMNGVGKYNVTFGDLDEGCQLSSVWNWIQCFWGCFFFFSNELNVSMINCIWMVRMLCMCVVCQLWLVCDCLIYFTYHLLFVECL